MLKLSSKKTDAPLRLDLGGGAALLIRKAETLDVVAAEGEAVRIAAAIEAGAEAASAYFPDLPPDAVLSEQRLAGLVDFLVEIELATKIVSGVENIELDGVPQTAPNRPLFALLFREPGVYSAFRRLARAGLHERTLQGNGSGSSPTGGPPAAPPIADPADASASPAPPAAAATTAASARNESTES